MLDSKPITIFFRNVNFCITVSQEVIALPTGLPHGGEHVRDFLCNLYFFLFEFHPRLGAAISGIRTPHKKTDLRLDDAERKNLNASFLKDFC